MITQDSIVKGTTTIRDGWLNPATSYSERVENGKITIVVRYWFRSYEFHISAAMTKEDMRTSKMRGTISIRSPEDSSIVLTKLVKISASATNGADATSGADAANGADAMSEADAAVKQSNSKFKEVKLSKEIVFNSTKTEVIKAHIEKSVEKFYEQNADFLDDRKKIKYDKKFITPAEAAKLFVDDFLRSRSNYLTLNDQTKKQYNNAILRIMDSISADVPMTAINENRVNNAFKGSNENNMRYLKLTKDFWDYCITKKQIHTFAAEDLFKNVVQKPTTKDELEKKADRLIKKSSCASTLSVEQEAILLKELLSNQRYQHIACGVAAELWGGFPLNDIVTFKFKNAIFHDYDPSFVSIAFLQPELAGAVKNFTRPLIPCGGDVFRTVFDSLCQQYPVSQVLDFPIVWDANDPKIPLKKEKLQDEIRKFLLVTGITRQIQNELDDGVCQPVSSVTLTNTYSNSLVEIFGENPREIGTVRFLKGMSLSMYTTSESYASFTGEAGQKRLYSFLARHQVGRKEYPDEPQHIECNGQRMEVVYPESNMERARAKITGSPQGNPLRIRVFAPRGVNVVKLKAK